MDIIKFPDYQCGHSKEGAIGIVEDPDFCPFCLLRKMHQWKELANLHKTRITALLDLLKEAKTKIET